MDGRAVLIATGASITPEARKMAPEVGLEPTTNRLIPASRDSNTELLNLFEELLANGPRRLPRFDLLFTSHCCRSARMRLRPDKDPRTVLSSEFAGELIGSVMTANSDIEIIRLADVKTSNCVLEYVNPEHRMLKSWLRR